MTDHLIGDVAEQMRLGRQSRERLDDHDVADGILRGTGQRGVQPFDAPLRGLGLPHHDGGEHQEDGNQHDQHKAEAPVEEKRHRQQHDRGQDGGKLVAEEHQPGPEQTVGAGQHALDQAAGMRPAMERQRQRQHVPEVAAHGFDTMAVGQTFRLQSDRDVADDAADADGDPDPEQQGGLVP